MTTVVFVAPYATPNTLQYVEALCALDRVTPAIVTADRADRFPAALRSRLAAIATVDDLTSAADLADAVRGIARRTGRVDRLFGALEQLQTPIAQARDLVGIDGAGEVATRLFRDKSAMKQALRAAGVPCARYQRAESEREIRAFVDAVGYPIIIKPVDGLGTRATFRVNGIAELDAVLSRIRIGPAHPVQVEEFLAGTEHSFETVSIYGKPVWSSSTDYIPGPLEVLETPWIQYCVVLPRETTNLEMFGAVNSAALDALGMKTGLSHMEWFRRPDGSVAVNEVGARPPGVNIMPMMGLTHGFDMVAAWVRLMALDEFDAPATRRCAAGSAFFRGQGRGDRVVAVHGLDEALAELGDSVVEIRRPQVGVQRAPGYEGEGYALVRADTTQGVIQALGRLVRNVRVELG